ncbi:helix-turn-helix domain-containing protein [Pediococcus pentosaceus]|uniref:helix-turn-helix domain-containing protein n=1 Tax=Pediococcus pentosaceus TaxID=1255 RepID=UPI000C072A74|nr:helix-turn-helix domain-containing protein [Pediococcus pentosaceus]
MKIDLDTKELIGSREASLMWDKQKDYVRTVFNKQPGRFPKGTIRKFGRQLIVTREGMEAVTGKKAAFTEKEIQEKEEAGSL